MIQNDRQYKITRAQAAKFRKTLATLKARPSDLPAPLANLERDAVKGQLATLEAEIQHYEKLKVGKIKLPSVVSVLDLPGVLIDRRITLNMTQAELAKEVDLHPQQIQQYEATGYRSANLERVGLVAEKLGVIVSPGVQRPSVGDVVSKRRPVAASKRKIVGQVKFSNTRKAQLVRAKAAKKNTEKAVGPRPQADRA